MERDVGFAVFETKQSRSPAAAVPDCSFLDKKGLNFAAELLWYQECACYSQIWGGFSAFERNEVPLGSRK